MSFVLSAIAGWATPMMEPKVRDVLQNMMQMKVDDDPIGFRILAFGIMLMLAAALTAVFQFNSSAFLAVLGGLMGYFSKPIIEQVKASNFTKSDEAAPKDPDA